MERLKELRLKKGVYQKDIASMLGIDRTTYNKYESGSSEPPIAMIVKLADYFGVSVDYLIGNSDQKDTQTVQRTEDSLRDEVFNLLDSLPDDRRQQALSYIRFLANG